MMPGRVYRRALERRRRSLQLRVVATTLVVSAAVVAVVGLLVDSQVRDSVLSTKTSTSLDQASKALTTFEASFTSGQPQDNAQGVPASIARAVGDANAAGDGNYFVAVLAGGAEPSGQFSPTTIDPSGTVSDSLRQAIAGKTTGQAWQYTRIVYNADGVRPRAGLVVAEPAPLTGVGATTSNDYGLYVFFPLDAEARNLATVQRELLIGGLGLILLFGGIAWLVIRQIIRPVRHVAGIAELLAAGRLQERMAVRGTDELAKLGLSFNKMADSLQRQIRELEDLSRVQRRFVSDVSHELRTPLTTVRMAADVLHAARVDFPPAVARSAELLQHELDRFESLLVDLLEISRHDARAAVLDAESVDLVDLVEQWVDLSRSHAGRTGCPLELELPEGPVLAEVDHRRVQRVVRNLVNNALEHGEDKPVRISLAADDDAVAIAVRDHGVGLRPGEATLVYNRFWRADAARARSSGGTGLGLAIALEDARLHGGWLQAWGALGRGANFRLTLPRRAGESVHSSPLPLEPQDAADDEPTGGDKATTREHDRPEVPPVTYRGIGQPRRTAADPASPSSEALRG
jgi:two-component system sensor histidine kinase MtrB